MAKLLTKSKYVAGLESDAYLWRLVNDPQSLPPPDLATQAKFDAGNEVGELAKTLFPEGVDIASESFIDNIKQTKKLVSERKIVFEAGFMVDGLYARADILVPVNEDQWDIVEVKSATSAKEVNIKDVAFQKYVYEKSGLIIRNCSIMHINNEYVRSGELDVSQFLTQTDITEEVFEEITNVPSNVEHMISIITLSECPAFDFKDIPKSEYGNPLIDEFMSALPEGSVFELTRGGKKCIELWSSGVQLLKDIPVGFKLSDKQQIQVDCARANEPNISVEGIKNFLSQIQYPIYHLDFETFQPVVPLFDNSRPYQQIPFQYSLHIEQEDGSVEHKEFLFTSTGDPREAFIQSLKSHVGEVGTILSYNQSFEIGRLKEIARDVPAYSSFVESLIDRFVDLIIPFRNFSYYSPKQKGSCSIKYVLPVFSDLSYSGMGIANGTEAMVAYLKYVVRKEPCEDYDKLISDMLTYCKQDTWAMVVILRKLRELVNRGC